MKITAIIVLLIVGMSTAYATSSMLMLHVGSGGAGGGAPIGGCGTGVIDLSTGCTQGMLGGL